jgi:O-antigen ligase
MSLERSRPPNVKLRISNLEASVIVLAIIASLAPQASATGRSVGYAVSVGAAMTAVAVLSLNRRLLNVSMALAQKALAFWLLSLTLLSSQLVLAVVGKLSFWGAAKTSGYVVILAGSYFLLGVAALRRMAIVWPAVSLVLFGISLFGVLGSLGLGPDFSGIEWEIPVLGLRPTSSILRDQNYFALSCYIGLLGSCYGYQLRALGLPRPFWLMIVGGQLTAFVLAYSRAAYLALAVAGCIWLLTDPRLRGLGRSAVVLGLAGCGLAFAVWIMTSEALRSFLQFGLRLTGRELLWSLSIRFIAENPVLGVGVGNLEELFLIHTQRWVSSHNTILDFALMTGVLGGLSLLIFILASVWRLIVRAGKSLERRFLLISLAGLLLISQFITFTPGGAGFGSLVFAVMLGQANAAGRQPSLIGVGSGGTRKHHRSRSLPPSVTASLG